MQNETGQSSFVNDAMQKFASWALIALVVMVLEMRLELAKQSKELELIQASVRLASELANKSWEETLQRKDVIDWVREFRQANGWDNSNGNYRINGGKK